MIGKPTRKVLSRTVLDLTGASSKGVIKGPSFGVDVSVLTVGRNRVMIANCDPISLIPALGPKDSALMSVNEVASDVATSANAPRYALFDLNLPARLSDRTLEQYWASISNVCSKLGVTIVGGHTGRFEGCDYSIVGGAMMWTFCRKNEYLTSNMARDGDDLLLTKSAAFGATAVLSRVFPQSVRRYVGPSLYRDCVTYFARMDTVLDSLEAASVGMHDKGVTAIHDVTEGGVYAAVFEMSSASRIGCVLYVDEIPVSAESLQVCKLFKIDPMRSLGEGSILVSSRPDKTGRILSRLKSRRVQATVIGRFTTKSQGVRGLTSKGETKIRYPIRDPYWDAYSRAMRKGWG
jgi:hydrogenase maturation factor